MWHSTSSYGIRRRRCPMKTGTYWDMPTYAKQLTIRWWRAFHYEWVTQGTMGEDSFIRPIRMSTIKEYDLSAGGREWESVPKLVAALGLKSRCSPSAKLTRGLCWIGAGGTGFPRCSASMPSRLLCRARREGKKRAKRNGTTKKCICAQGAAGVPCPAHGTKPLSYPEATSLPTRRRQHGPLKAKFGCRRAGLPAVWITPMSIFPGVRPSPFRCP